MAIKKSDLYSSLWASCDELRGGMDRWAGFAVGVLQDSRQQAARAHALAGRRGLAVHCRGGTDSKSERPFPCSGEGERVFPEGAAVAAGSGSREIRATATWVAGVSSEGEGGGAVLGA
jgi:hypothetical protein